MPPTPTLEFATGAVRLDRGGDRLLVDPDAALVDAVVDAWRSAVPALVDPDPETLRAAAERGGDGDGSAVGSQVAGSAGVDEEAVDPAAVDVPRLRVLGTADALAAATDGFHRASRVAALREADALDLRVLEEPQPNAVLAGPGGDAVVVPDRDGESGGGSKEEEYVRVGSDRRLRSRYDGLAEAAEPYLLRTPSRHRVHRAFAERCDPALAGDVLRLLDASPDLGRDGTDDPVGPRVRPYLAGARRGVDDYALRRACEDAGLGSPSTFTRVKRRLVDAGLVETEAVPQPVGRPRKRLVAVGGLRDAPIEEVPEVARRAME